MVIGHNGIEARLYCAVHAGWYIAASIHTVVYTGSRLLGKMMNRKKKRLKY
jgi:hypothetical protein